MEDRGAARAALRPSTSRPLAAEAMSSFAGRGLSKNEQCRRLLSEGANVPAEVQNEKTARLDRRAAHERLSTGALARWARACATHPWRVVLAWVGLVALFIALVVTIGGSLRDEFEIPGSDTQKATDLIESEFASEQGGVLNLVFAAPPGQRLDTPARKAAIERAVAKLKTREFKPTKDKRSEEH